MFENKLILTT